MVRGDSKRTWPATAVYCGGTAITGLLLEASVLSYCIVAVLCGSLLFYGESAYGSRIKTAKLLIINSGLLALLVVLLRVILNNVAFLFRPSLFPWFYRMFRMWWLSECSAIILTLLAGGLALVELAGKIGGGTARTRFQRCVVAAASILVAINVANLLRPVRCADCFFPYGLPFTFFTDGGFAGGGGIVWYGLIADAMLIPASAAIFTLLWNQIAT